MIPIRATGEIPDHLPGTWFKDFKILLWMLPKNASTSIGAAITPWCFEHGIHFEPVHNRSIAGHYASEKGARVLAVSRNPFSRLVSAWGMPYNREIPFRDFASAVAAIGDDECDRHVRSQTWGVPGNIEWFRMEDRGFWSGIQDVFRLRGSSPPDLEVMNRGHGSHELMYDYETKRIVRARYSADLNRLGYS